MQILEAFKWLWNLPNTGSFRNPSEPGSGTFPNLSELSEPPESIQTLQATKYLPDLLNMSGAFQYLAQPRTFVGRDP